MPGVQWRAYKSGDYWYATGTTRHSINKRVLDAVVVPVQNGNAIVWDVLFVGMPLCWGTRSWPDDTPAVFIERLAAKSPLDHWKVF